MQSPTIKNQTLRVMNVLELNANKRGGMEEYLIRLSQELKFRGGESLVVLKSCNQEIQKSLQESGNKVFQLPQNSGSFSYVLNLLQLIRKHQPDLVVLNFFGHRNILAPIIRLIGQVPCVYVDHHSGDGRNQSYIKRLLAKFLYSLSLGPCAKIIAVSEFVKNRQITNCGISEDKIEVVYNGVRPASIQEKQKAPALRQELGIPASSPVVLGVGNMIIEKGFHVLINAVSEIQKLHPSVNLVLAGEGPERLHLEQQARSLGLKNIHFLGRRDDVQSLQWMADVLVCPSIWAEAFGFTIIEAMINQRPVIACSVGGIPELIVDGISGLKVLPDNVESLAMALNQLLSSESLRQSLGKAGEKRANEMFHLDRMVAQMLDIFCRVTHVKSL